MNHNHNTTFKKLQQQQHDPSAMNRTFTPSPSHSSNLASSFTNTNGEMMKKLWRSCGKKALMKFKLTELKEELRKKGCTLHGNKAELVERLHEKYMSEEQTPSSSHALASSSSSSTTTPSSSIVNTIITTTTSPESISSTCSSLGSSPNSSISSSTVTTTTTPHNTSQSGEGLTKSASSGSLPSPSYSTKTTHTSPNQTMTDHHDSSNTAHLNEQRKSAYIKKNTSNTPVVTFAPFSAMMMNNNTLQDSMNHASSNTTQMSNNHSTTSNSSLTTTMGSNSSASSNTTHHSPHHTTSPPSSSSSLHASTNMLLSPLPSVNRDALLSPPSRVSSAPPASMFTPHHHATPLISPPFHPLYASMYSSAATNTGAIVSPPNNGSSLFSTNSLGNSNSLTSPGVVGGVNGSNSSSGSTSSPSALHSQQQNGKNKTSSALPPASNVQLPPPPNISALPSTSSLYSPLFYGAHNSKLPTYPLAYKFNTPLQPISPYQNPYGMPFMNFSAFYNVNGPMGQTTKKKKKKKNTSNENTAVLNSESVPSSSQELTQQQQVESSGFETDEFLSLEEIEYYNSNVDYNSSSDDHGNTSQKRCLSDTELYFDQGLDSETYNILYPQPTNVPHKNKKQKQEHLNTELNGYYDDLFYDNKDNLEIQETANLTPTNEALNGSSNVVHDISFRVRLYIDSNSSDEKDVVVKDDKTWPEVVRQLISDYQPFYKSFLFDLPSDNFTIILHSKQEEKILSEDSTILASRLSGSDSITITLKQTDHHLCRFNLEVDSITSNGINLNEEDGYDQDNEDDDELEVEESQQDHEDEHNQEEMNCADQMFLNLIESM